MNNWHRLDGTKVPYENPFARRSLWINPQGAAFYADRAYPYIGTASFLNVAGTIRAEGEMILAGWRRVVGAPIRRTSDTEAS